MRDGEAIKVDVTGPLTVHLGGATDLLVDVAIAGTGIVPLFEDWLRPHFQSDALEPILEPWWPRSRGRISIPLDGGLFRRRCGPLSISSRRQPSHRFSSPRRQCAVEAPRIRFGSSGQPINQLRAFLIERGIAVPTGFRVMGILKNPEDEISPRMSDLIVSRTP
jgi:hypothetical protein